eukprot:IDg16385t1
MKSLYANLRLRRTTNQQWNLQSLTTRTKIVPLGKKRVILRYIGKDHSPLEAAQSSMYHKKNVAGITNSRVTLEAATYDTSQRRNMTLGEKMKVLHFIENQYSLLQASNKYGIDNRTVKCILGACETLIAMAKSGVSENTRRPLKAQYQEIEPIGSSLSISHDHSICRSRSVSFRNVLGYLGNSWELYHSKHHAAG